MGQVRRKQAGKGVETYTYCAGESLRIETSTGGAVYSAAFTQAGGGFKATRLTFIKKEHRATKVCW